MERRVELVAEKKTRWRRALVSLVGRGLLVADR